MAPPSYGFRLMRDAALRLGLADERVRSLVNPRQSSPISYEGSPLNAHDGLAGQVPGSAPGEPAPELMLRRGDEIRHLSQFLGRGFVMLGVGLDAQALGVLRHASNSIANVAGLPALRVVAVSDDASNGDADTWRAAHGGLSSYQSGAVYAIRPDGYVLGRWPAAQAQAAAQALAPFHTPQTRL
jgi:3-(3-hydroxy-phenyl)propionate hydroxylase